MSKKISRRKVLVYGLSGFTLLAGGGVAWRAWNQDVFRPTDGPAYEPWASWDRTELVDSVRIGLAGILAASAHNSQPWHFEFVGNRILVSSDPNRHLGAFDPYRREMYISVGCAIENMCQAAITVGYSPEVKLVSGDLSENLEASETEQLAEIRLLPSTNSMKSLAEAIPIRHTNRGEYDRSRTLTGPQAREAEKLASDLGDYVRLRLFSTEEAVDRLGQLIVRSTEFIINDKAMAESSAEWFRFSPVEIQEHRDGVTLDAVGLPPLKTVLAKILPAPDEAQAHEQWLSATRDRHVASAPLFGVIETQSLYGKSESLAAGRLWQRLHLWATMEGLAAHPLNQPVEVVDRQKSLGQESDIASELTSIVGNSDWRPTFIFRLGYGLVKAQKSPRRDFQSAVTLRKPNNLG